MYELISWLLVFIFGIAIPLVWYKTKTTKSVNTIIWVVILAILIVLSIVVLYIIVPYFEDKNETELCEKMGKDAEYYEYRGYVCEYSTESSKRFVGEEVSK